MYGRIERPFLQLLKRAELKDHPAMAKITEEFLTIANGLSLYELLHHRHWSVFFSIGLTRWRPFFLQVQVITRCGQQHVQSRSPSTKCYPTVGYQLRPVDRRDLSRM